MKANIMIIDDDYYINEYHKIILTEAKIVENLTICESADHALRALKKLNNAPDIIYLDVNMPKKDGWAFLQEYRHIDDQRKAKFLIMLSSTDLPSQSRTNEGTDLINAFEVKPLQVEQVSSLIKKII